MTNNKISAGTIARTAVLALALTNQILSATGHSPLPIESEQLEQIITTGITVVASLVAWWENNSFTSAAIHADHVLNQMQGKE
jgi:SPP1 family holin|uniref:Holin n=1 Tax=Siphoviridae sp. ctpV36 TaxID=2827279 RepID=A0A8S5R681_9CAUD|nr:MAG TPA: holin [Siphoviridae sp. ctpV36]DAH43706.1 MAG TPA: holin [Caudoviricetes sp.]DAI56897.1 MAG TPA: holin [Caudoviricetes sp.]DAK88012.1 MAG TPA: holin [Caudoviricetes sp.]